MESFSDFVHSGGLSLSSLSDLLACSMVLCPRIASSSLKNFMLLLVLPESWALFTLLYSCFRFLYFVLHCFQSLSMPNFWSLAATCSNILLFRTVPSSCRWMFLSDQTRIRALTSLTVQCFPPSFATVGMRAGVLGASAAGVGPPAWRGVGERHRHGLPALGARVGRGQTEWGWGALSAHSLSLQTQRWAGLTWTSSYWLLICQHFCELWHHFCLPLKTGIKKTYVGLNYLRRTLPSSVP